MFFGILVARAEDIEMIKRYNKSFKVSKDAQVDLINKYGDIIVKTWNKDSVRFNIKITAYGKSNEAVNKLLDRVDFESSNSGRFLKFESVFDRSSGSFKEFWNSLGDYSKVLINKNNLNIDFEVYMPKTADMYLENKFGDVFINEFLGRCKINMSQGDLKVGDMKGPLNLELKFGKASIQQVKYGNLNLQIAEVTIVNASKLNINSSSSTIRITDLGELKLDSRNDKYFLRNVRSINGESTFSEISITSLESELINISNYGDLRIEELKSSLKLINLSCKSTDISMWINPEAAFDIDIKAKEEKLHVPGEWSGLDSYYLDDKNKYVRKSGIINNNSNAKIFIDNQGGSLNIYKK